MLLTDDPLWIFNTMADRDPTCLFFTGMRASYSGLPNSCTVPEIPSV